MNEYLSEFIGTAILLIFGNGVVANVILDKTKGNNSGWLVITMGWAMAVFIAVYCTSKYSGGHLNPAVTIAMATAEKFEWAKVPGYILAQVLGGLVGGLAIWLHYKEHFDETKDPSSILACFSTGPAIRNNTKNLLAEIFATFVFVLSIFFISPSATSMGSLSALPVALLVLGVGLSLGGNTGYAINPARDLGPRLAHAIASIPNKGSGDWSYAWIPVIGPIIGGALAAIVYGFLIN